MSGLTRPIIAAAATAGVFFAPVLPSAHPSVAPPVLRTDPGNHTQMITQIVSDSACAFVATSSHDKTVRVWSVPGAAGGKFVHRYTVRLPIGAGNEGSVYSLALSSDGYILAAGGWDVADGRSGGREQHGVYLIDTRFGGVMARLSGHGNVITSLAFSPSGHLAVGLAGGKGIRLWHRDGEVSPWRIVAEDTGYGHASVASVAFDKSGRLFALTDDGRLLRYDDNLRVDKARQVEHDEPARTLALHPSGERLAVGFGFSPAIHIIETESLKTIAVDRRSSGRSNALAWSGDGTKLYASGHGNDGRGQIVFWTDGVPEAKLVDLETHGTITDLATCGDAVAVATSGSEFGILSSNGRLRGWQGNVRFGQYYQPEPPIAVSKDGRIVRFPLTAQGKPVFFDLEQETLSESPPDVALHVAETHGLEIRDWRNSFEPNLDRKKLELDAFEMTRALAIASDTSSFVLGTEWSLRRYDAQGKLLWRRVAPGPVAALTLTPDDQYLVALHRDGTIRWYRFRDGEQILSLFANVEDGRWAAWTPDGYYMASPGSEEHVPLGWHFNRDSSNSADFFPIHLFRDHYYRPDIVLNTFAMGQESMDSVDERERIGETHGGFWPKPPPVIDPVNPRVAGDFDTAIVRFSVEARSSAPIPVDYIAVRIDGVHRRNVAVPSGETGTMRVDIDLELPPRDVVVSFVPRAGPRSGLPISLPMRWRGPVGAPAPKPRLRALLIGVQRYRDSSLELKATANDAKDLEHILRQQSGHAYREVETRLLIDPDRRAMLQEIAWLKDGAGDDDISLVFFAGHGVTDLRRRFQLLPADADVDELDSTAVNGALLIQTLRATRGRVVAIIDACHSADTFMARSGGVLPINMTRFSNDAATPDNGVMIFAASTARQFAFDAGSWGQNGVFTKALIEGLAGKADANGDGLVRTDELYRWTRSRVRELTKDRQDPIKHQSFSVQDFVFASR